MLSVTSHTKFVLIITRFLWKYLVRNSQGKSIQFSDLKHFLNVDLLSVKLFKKKLKGVSIVQFENLNEHFVSFTKIYNDFDELVLVHKPKNKKLVSLLS